MSEVKEDLENKKEMVNIRNDIQHNCTKLLYTDFDVPCIELAKNLLGHQLCRRLDTGEEVKGIIVETECYLGGDDKGSHSFNGKKTERNAAMFMSPGTAYVYSTYGMYFCFNISSKGDGAAVLLRALEPSFGLEAMKENRERNHRGKSVDKKKKPFTEFDLCSGPSKLCMSFAIDKSLNKEDMVNSTKLWVERPTIINSSLHYKNQPIVACARIGIDSVGKEWASKPLRFYILGNPYVSKRDKKAEQNIIS